MRRLRSHLAGRFLKLAERLDPGYGFRWMSPYTFTYEIGEGIRWRDDGRGCPLWYVERHKNLAYWQADTEWMMD